MVYKTNITQKGQLTIPKPIRDSLMLKPNIRVAVWLEGEALKIKPSHTILDIAGTLNPVKVVSAVLLREKMAKNYGNK